MFTIANLLLIVFLVSLAVTITHFVKEHRFQNRPLDKYFIRRAEAQRVAQLPGLSTKGLMQITEKRATCYSRTLVENKKTFRVRDGFVFIVDERGKAWIGRVIPTVIAALCDAEYLESRAYHVPICGENQAFMAPPVPFDDITVPIYPAFLNFCFTDGAEWTEWLKIERYYRETYANAELDWKETLDWMYPKDKRRHPSTI